MPDLTKDIKSVTRIRRKSRDSVNQRLLDEASRADVYEAIRQGLDDVAHGRTRAAREVFDDIRRRYDIPLASGS